MSCATESCDGWCGICRGHEEARRIEKAREEGEKAAEARIVAWLEKRLETLRSDAKQQVSKHHYDRYMLRGDEVSCIKHGIERGEHRESKHQ